MAENNPFIENSEQKSQAQGVFTLTKYFNPTQTCDQNTSKLPENDTSFNISNSNNNELTMCKEDILAANTSFHPTNISCTDSIYCVMNEAKISKKRSYQTYGDEGNLEELEYKTRYYDNKGLCFSSIDTASLVEAKFDIEISERANKQFYQQNQPKKYLAERQKDKYKLFFTKLVEILALKNCVDENGDYDHEVLQKVLNLVGTMHDKCVEFSENKLSNCSDKSADMIKKLKIKNSLLEEKNDQLTDQNNHLSKLVTDLENQLNSSTSNCYNNKDMSPTTIVTFGRNSSPVYDNFPTQIYPQIDEEPDDIKSFGQNILNLINSIANGNKTQNQAIPQNYKDHSIKANHFRQFSILNLFKDIFTLEGYSLQNFLNRPIDESFIEQGNAFVKDLTYKLYTLDQYNNERPLIKDKIFQFNKKMMFIDKILNVNAERNSTDQNFLSSRICRIHNEYKTELLVEIKLISNDYMNIKLNLPEDFYQPNTRLLTNRLLNAVTKYFEVTFSSIKTLGL